MTTTTMPNLTAKTPLHLRPEQFRLGDWTVLVSGWVQVTHVEQVGNETLVEYSDGSTRLFPPFWHRMVIYR